MILLWMVLTYEGAKTSLSLLDKLVKLLYLRFSWVKLQPYSLDYSFDNFETGRIHDCIKLS
jgi:hypothetical protein